MAKAEVKKGPSKSEIYASIADSTQLSKKQVAAVMDALTTEIAKCIPAWRRVVAYAAENGYPVPVFASTLSYYDAVRSERLPAALVQAQRDFFGAHTYQRVDKDGTFHTLWSEDGRREVEQLEVADGHPVDGHRDAPEEGDDVAEAFGAERLEEGELRLHRHHVRRDCVDDAAAEAQAGVGGGTAQEDEDCARAGVEKL